MVPFSRSPLFNILRGKINGALHCPRLQSVPQKHFHQLEWGYFKKENSNVAAHISKISTSIVQTKYLFQGKRELSLMRSTESNSGILQPVIDFEFVAKNQEAIQRSINARGLTTKFTVKELAKMYETVKQYKTELEAIELEKEENSRLFHTIKAQRRQSGQDSEQYEKATQEMQEKGRDIRERLRTCIQNYNKANDALVEAVLELPNVLDAETPLNDRQLVCQSAAPTGVKLWNFRKDLPSDSTSCDAAEKTSQSVLQFPLSYTSADEKHLSRLAQDHLTAAGFSEIATVDTVRKTILHSMGMESNNILRLRECNAKSGDSHAVYVTGAASIPSILLLFTQSVIDTSPVLSLRNYVVGRSYISDEGGISKHNCVVQCIIACRDQASMDMEFNNLKITMEDFYATKVGVEKFQVQCAPAFELAVYERKKYIFITNKIEKRPSRRIGEVSVIGDHLSKRLLCCFKDTDGRTKFLHFIHAKFFDISNFLRGNVN